MANPNVLSVDTVLYCPAEPKGRMFPAGEPWPGDIWSSVRGGEPAGKNAAAGALKDLIAANDQLDAAHQTIASQAHDLDERAAERDAANGKVADLEQRAIAAETATTTAEQSARDYMLERDQARSDLQYANAKADAAAQAVIAAEAKIADLVSQLDAANQTIADLNGSKAPAKAKKADAPAAEDAGAAQGSDTSTGSAG